MNFLWFSSTTWGFWQNSGHLACEKQMCAVRYIKRSHGHFFRHVEDYPISLSFMLKIRTTVFWFFEVVNGSPFSIALPHDSRCKKFWDVLRHIRYHWRCARKESPTKWRSYVRCSEPWHESRENRPEMKFNFIGGNASDHRSSISKTQRIPQILLTAFFVSVRTRIISNAAPRHVCKRGSCILGNLFDWSRFSILIQKTIIRVVYYTTRKNHVR